MQTTYGAGRRKSRHNGAERKKRKDRRQLAQLLVCLAVFLTVFIGKGVWPSQVAQTGQQLLQVLRANTDFRAAFTDLGFALSRQESVLGELGDFCVSVFAPAQQESTQEEPAVAPEKTQEEPLDDTASHLAQYVEPSLAVGDVVQETQTEELPEGYSGQWLYLGDLQTVTPVMGAVTSRFGYREHPTKGRYAVHAGVDIAADRGTAVGAFAEGTVAQVGENEDFGRYLLIQHPNGVSTFYSHCHSISVRAGEEVSAGQTVAQVGSTGQSTGAHLHFEVRLNNVRLDPLHYIQPEQEV